MAARWDGLCLGRISRVHGSYVVGLGGSLRDCHLPDCDRVAEYAAVAERGAIWYLCSKHSGWRPGREWGEVELWRKIIPWEVR